MNASSEVSQPKPINWYYYPSVRLATQPKLKTASNSWVLYRIEKYVNGLMVQWNRMIEDLFLQQQIMTTDLSKDVQAQGAFYQVTSRLGLDIHFYLICWDKINKYLGRFARNMSEYSCIQSVWKNLGPLRKKRHGRGISSSIFTRILVIRILGNEDTLS